MIQFSKYNVFSKIRGSDKYFIINQLSGNADILDSEEAGKYLGFFNEPQSDDDFRQELVSKGYLSDEDEERHLFRKKYLDFLDARESDEIQLFFVTNYSCNFSCSYCYQDQYNQPEHELSTDIIDALFSYIKKEFSGRRKYITIFGGEPLLPGKKQKKLIDYFIEKANREKLEICVVTNGYTLSSYQDILKKESVREIQVTLDGTAEIHNKRRHLIGGSATFDAIIVGIDACLESGIPVNLRIVIDRENIDNLPDLAKFAIEKGWTENSLFKTQIGRNYELHHCQSSPEKLFSRIALYESISELIKDHPHVLKFHKPAFSVTRFLTENGTLPDPLFDSCPACKTEWAFDYTGKIYSCTATVGKSDESLGAFYPEIKLFDTLAEEWQSRDIISIPECRNCNLQLSCGGGCGSVARNRTGEICTADCRPIKELMEIGFSHYL